MKHQVVIASSLAIALCVVLAGAQIPTAKGLDIYVIDVEGGNATLFVTPARESIGAVDLFVVSHHGSSTSNSAALVHAIEPRVAIMNNGPAKGGQPEALKNIHLAPGLEDLWQLHFSVLSGQEYTTPGMFIANTFDEDLVAMPVGAVPSPQPGQAAPRPPVHNGAAHWIRVSAQPDGSFTVMNSRNGLSKTYAARAAGAAR